MKKALLILLLLPALALPGCATMSAEECETADWRRIGYEDGADGKPMSALNDRDKACQSHGFQADFSKYKEGREDGLSVFCDPANGYRVGAEGRSYAGACVANNEEEFLAEYERGYELYTFTSAVSEAESEVSSLEYDIRECKKDLRKLNNWLDENRDSSVSAELEEEIAKKRKKRRKLRDQLDDLYDELDFARARLFEAERALNAYRISRY